MQAVLNIIGRVGNVRTFDGEGGKKTVIFSVAVDQRRNGQAQEGEKSPIWYSFRASNGIAEALAQHLTKGRLVGVCGVSPRIRTYEVERSLAIQGVGTVKFKDTRQEIEYLLADFRFLDAPPDTQAKRVAEATIVANEAGHEATAQPITPDNLPF